MKKKFIIFDLDGVLINSIHNMKYAWVNSCKKNNLKISFFKYERFIGLPFMEILKKLNIKKQLHSSVNKEYNFYSKKMIHKLKLKRKVILFLKKLKKEKCIALYTSKNLNRTNLILGNNKHLFKYILCPRKDLRGKPFPDGINYLIKKSKFKKKDTILLGDSIYDFKAARKANIDYLHAEWGYQKIKVNKNFILKKIEDMKYFID